MPPTVIIAETYEQYERICTKHGLDQKDRKQAIPLVMWTDKYRLYGRDLKGSKVLRIGNIHPEFLKTVKRELQKSGWGK